MRRPVVVVALLWCAAAPAGAAERPVVGIGDQNATSYQDPAMLRLPLETARLALAWDWYRDPYLIAHTDQWIAAVRAAGLRPQIAFNRHWRRNGGRQVPPLRTYRRSFRLLRDRYPHVREFSPWNEPNAKEQPFHRKPRLAARYFNAMRSACTRCTVLAGDVNDGRNMVPWLTDYKRSVRGARIWALHNYKDSTRSRGTTSVFLRTVSGPVWLTETGGLRNRGGLQGQAEAVRRVFALARAHGRIKRIYFYQWRAVRGRRWDSAFVAANGKPRPAYFALRAGLRRR